MSNPQNLLDWWESIHLAMRGRDLPFSNHRKALYYSEEDIQKGSSANHCTLAGVLAYAESVMGPSPYKSAKYSAKLATAWTRYVTSLDLETREPLSGHIYATWIRVPKRVVWALAMKAGHEELAAEMARSLITTDALLTLAASARLDGNRRFKGPMVACHHTRGAISSGNRHHERYDKNGIAKPIYFLGDNFAYAELGGALRTHRPGEELGKMESAAKAKLGRSLFSYMPPTMRKDLIAVRTNTKPLAGRAAGAFDRVVTWLEDNGHFPTGHFDLGKSEGGVWSVGLYSVNHGSTDFLNGVAIHDSGAPSGSRFRRLPWNMPKALVANWTGDCRRRSAGLSGVSEIDTDRRTMRCQRAAKEDFFDQRTNKFVKGWWTEKLPSGEMIHNVRVGKIFPGERKRTGIEILYPTGEGPRPKPKAAFLIRRRGTRVREFLNQSTHAERCTWDFGDGSAPVETPSLDPEMHTFPSGDGKYTVRLTAHHGSESNVVVKTVSIKDKTLPPPKTKPSMTLNVSSRGREVVVDAAVGHVRVVEVEWGDGSTERMQPDRGTVALAHDHAGGDHEIVVTAFGTDGKYLREKRKVSIGRKREVDDWTPEEIRTVLADVRATLRALDETLDRLIPALQLLEGQDLAKLQPIIKQLMTK